MSSTANLYKSPKADFYSLFAHPAISLWAGVLASGIGLLTVIGWLTHTPVLIKMSDEVSPMVFNTTLGITFSGLALVMHSRRKDRLVNLCALVLIVIGGLTTAEYIFNVDLGIDALFLKSWLASDAMYPDRMAVMTAGTLLLIGLNLLLINQKFHPAIVAGFSLIISMIGAVGISRFLNGTPLDFGFKYFNKMAPQTAIAFIMMGLGLTSIALQLSRSRALNWIIWFPFVISLVLLFSISVITLQTLFNTNSDSSWRERTHAFEERLHIFSTNITKIPTSAITYAITTEAKMLEPYNTGIAASSDEFKRLHELTNGNANQKKALNELQSVRLSIINWCEELITAKKRNETDKALAMVTERGGEQLLAKADKITTDMLKEETRLKTIQEQELRSSQHSSVLYVLLGILLTFGLSISAWYWIAREISKRNSIEDELRAVSQLQTAILDAANYAIVSTTETGVVKTFNRGAERLLGYSAMDVVGKLTPAPWHLQEEVVRRADELSIELGKSIEPGFESFAAKARLGLLDENEWTFIRKDGTRLPGFLSATALRDSNGSVTGFVGIVTDLTARKRAEMVLDQFFVQSLDILCIAGLDGYFKRVNPSFSEALGFTSNELTSQPFLSLIHPDDIAATQAEVKKLSLGILTLNFENRYRCKNGSYRLIAWKCSPSDDGLLYASGRDITDSRNATEQLRNSEERFRNALEYSAIGMAIVGLDGHWLQVNKALCEIIGYSQAELLLKTFQDITHPEDLETDLGYVRQLLSKEITHYQMEKRYFHKSGETVWVMLSVSLIRDSMNNPIHFVAQIQNITQSKIATEQLENALKEKEMLLKEIHHRVKNNLSVISSLLQLQMNENQDPRLVSALRESQLRVKSMALIHEKLYKSGIRPHVGMADYLASLSSMLLSTYSTSKKIELDCQLEDVQVSIDAAIPLGLIANELITNALKYAFPGDQKGVISIRIYQEQEGVCFEISDNGVGMPADISKIHNSLGLNLVSMLTKQIGGVSTLKTEKGVSFQLKFSDKDT